MVTLPTVQYKLHIGLSFEGLADIKSFLYFSQAQAAALERKKKELDDLSLTESSLLSLLENSI